MTEPLEQKAQKAFDKGKNDALAGRLSDVEEFENNLVVQHYFSGFATGKVEKAKVPENEKKMYVLEFSRGMSDANAGHHPVVFGGAYFEGFMLLRQSAPRQRSYHEAELDYINEIRFDYDLPPITRDYLTGYE